MKKYWQGHVLRLCLWLLTFSLSPQQLLGGTTSLGIEHPLGGTRYMFVSPVDQKVWGIVCPDSLESYLGKSRDEILRCGYSLSYGPITMNELLRNIPEDIDPYMLEQGLRADTIVPVATNRDKYYEVWGVLEKLSGVLPTQRPHLPTNCHQSSCQPAGIAFSVDVMSQDAVIYIYATEGQGHLGSYIVGANDGSRMFYLNVQQKAVLNLTCGNTTVYLSRALKDRVIVNISGGHIRYFYL